MKIVYFISTLPKILKDQKDHKLLSIDKKRHHKHTNEIENTRGFLGSTYARVLHYQVS